MNAFNSALADEVAQAWATLARARREQDEAAVTDAVDRLHDLDEIRQRVSEGLVLAAIHP
ncbi:hypothetical protein RKE38_05495 [Phycicoccus sp. M110.8]|uniref:hypothetical protein n=1 Tax=Phycicoccus sp. M110.8 TaxID=3075433 RepID=UPI0028FD3614|nr:hypothetical protein [Phycicoccus sp. M110.8]MDU0313135.1 hypothetical protein [Phycicoccus sp. M110.8]